MSEELPWLSLSEAAAMSGLARETVRARARRGLIPSRKGNEGRVVVQLAPVDEPPPAQDKPADMSELVSDLHAEMSELRERLARTEGEANAAAEIILELRAALAWHRLPWWRRIVGS